MSGRPVFPGAGYFEAAGAGAALLAAGGRSGGSAAAEAALADVAIVAPLLLPAPGSSGAGTLLLQASYSAADGAVTVQSAQGGSRAKPTAHVEGYVVAAAALAPPRGSRQQAAQQPAARLSAGRRLLATAMQQRSAAAVADLARCSHDESAVHVSPAVLDCCLQLAAVPAGDGKLRIPAGVGLLLLGGKAHPAPGSSSSGCMALARPSAAASAAAAGDSGATFTDYRLAQGQSGQAACAISEMEARPMGSAAPPRRRQPIKRLSPAAAAAGTAGSGQLLQDEWLYSLEWLARGSDGSAAAAEAGAAAAAGGVQLAPGSAADTAAAAIAVGQQAVAGSLQSLALVTRGAQPVAAPGPAAAAGAGPAAGLWAFARTVAQELTSFSVQAVDLQQQALGGSNTAAASLLAAPASQAPALLPPSDQLSGSTYGYAVQGGGLVAAALQRSAVKPLLPAFQLFPQPRGALQNLTPLAVQTGSVPPGQVLVAVKAVGINFR